LDETDDALSNSSRSCRSWIKKVATAKWAKE
jgi:hypothetical protein